MKNSTNATQLLGGLYAMMGLTQGKYLIYITSIMIILLWVSKSLPSRKGDKDILGKGKAWMKAEHWVGTCYIQRKEKKEVYVLEGRW